MKTITVNGEATLNFKVNYIYVYLDVNHEFNNYDECIRDSELVSSRVSDLIESAGFKKKELKLTSFNITPVIERYNENNVYKTRNMGFKYSKNYKLGMKYDLVKLGKLLEALESNDDKITFNLSFALKDNNMAKDEVLKRAIKNANDKAKFIAKETKLKIKDIENIEYHAVNNNYERNANIATLRGVQDFNPEDIRVSDSVRITYSVE